VSLSHLVPFSYVDRGFNGILCFLWIIQHITFSRTGWEKLNFLDASNRNVRTAIAWFIMLSLACLICSDSMNMKFKYQEGYLITRQFVDEGKNITHYFVKPMPASMWTPGNEKNLVISTTLLNLAFIFKSTSHFLVLAFWNTISKKTLNTAFASTKEFRAYQFFSMASIALYFIMQGAAPTVATSITWPQYVEHCENLCIIFLILLVNFRLRRVTKQLKFSREVHERIKFYRRVNMAQLMFLILDLVGLGGINLDLGTNNIISASPIWTDIFTHFFDIGFPGACITLILTIMPEFYQDEKSPLGRKKSESTIQTSASKKKNH